MNKKKRAARVKKWLLWEAFRYALYAAFIVPFILIDAWVLNNNWVFLVASILVSLYIEERITRSRVGRKVKAIIKRG